MPGTGTTIPRKVPLRFQLKLIAEVKKHNIIWLELTGKKNKDLLEDAWQKVSKALLIQNVESQTHWKRLVRMYRAYHKGNYLMKQLVYAMAFLAPQFKKSSSDYQSDSDAVEVDPPKKEKPKKRKCTAKSDPISEAEELSAAIFSFMFTHVDSESMLTLTKPLVGMLINVLPEMDAKISEHAKQHLQRSGNMDNIDWSELDIPAIICKAVWDYKVLQKFLKD